MPMIEPGTLGTIRDLFLPFRLFLLMLTAAVLAASTPQQRTRDLDLHAKPARLSESSGSKSSNDLRSITVEFEMKKGEEGVLITGGDESELFTLDVKDERLVWTYQCIFEKQALTVVSDVLRPGLVTVRFEFDQEQTAEFGRHKNGRMFVNGELVRSNPGGDELANGDRGGLQRAITPRFSFTGIIRRLVVNEKITP